MLPDYPSALSLYGIQSKGAGMAWFTRIFAVCGVASGMPSGHCDGFCGVSAAQAGPMILAGIDAEDGGPVGHGSIATYL